jgi:hypothetical protein
VPVPGRGWRRCASVWGGEESRLSPDDDEDDEEDELPEELWEAPE